MVHRGRGAVVVRISVVRPGGSGRVELHVLTASAPWRVTRSGRGEEALLDPGPGTPAFLAEAYPGWLRELCSAIDADRQLAEVIVAEVERRR